MDLISLLSGGQPEYIVTLHGDLNARTHAAGRWAQNDAPGAIKAHLAIIRAGYGRLPVHRNINII